MCGPVSLRWGEWRWLASRYSAQVAEFNSKISDFARLYPRRIDSSEIAPPDYQVVDKESPYDIPGVGQVYFADRMSGREIAGALRTKYPQVPGWYRDAIAAD